MIRLTDGNITAEIVMNNWDGNGWTPDWSLDFFGAGGLEYNDETDTYKVEDVEYCIEQARDWQNAIGDFLEDDDIDTSDRNVEVCYV
jgi:hypothetical protein